MISDRKAHTQNITLAIGGVLCSADTPYSYRDLVNQSLVLRMNICGERPAHRKSEKRWR